MTTSSSQAFSRQSKTRFKFLPLFLALTIAPASWAADEVQQESLMTAAGTFEVQLEPQSDDLPAGRMTLDKHYSGGMLGVGKGQMISKRTAEGSAVYAAIEEFEGSVDGKAGSFTLFHTGKMSASSQSLDIVIVDGSGTEELENINGSLQIIKEGDTHNYVLNYEL